MNIFCLLSNYCFLVVLGDGVQFEILHFQMNFFSIPRILTRVDGNCVEIVRNHYNRVPYPGKVDNLQIPVWDPLKRL